MKIFNLVPARRFLFTYICTCVPLCIREFLSCKTNFVCDRKIEFSRHHRSRAHCLGDVSFLFFHRSFTPSISASSFSVPFRLFFPWLLFFVRTLWTPKFKGLSSNGNAVIPRARRGAKAGNSDHGRESL